MSIGSLGLIGSLAASPLPLKAAEADKALREAGDRDRQAESARRAESAAGIGETEEDSEAQDRDPDGRQPWQRSSAKRGAGDAQSEPPNSAPGGQTGGQLDLIA
ncbi:MAG: hypothetical protein L0211_26400 [Planctomycetaceae bacterium]|nr:hypothetical protein [Planctomycetaceae bacterium]